MKEINYQHFSKEMIENGSFASFVGELMKQCYSDKGDLYNEILIKPEDCGAFSVSWKQLPWDHEYGGGFEYVAEDQAVMTECQFPDDHYEYFLSEEDYNAALVDWLAKEEAKGTKWEKNEWGRWYNKTEQEAWEKSLKEGE